jgi:hypothetical protein
MVVVARREASHATARAQNAHGRIMPAGGKDGATQGLVDHGGGPPPWAMTIDGMDPP